MPLRMRASVIATVARDWLLPIGALLLTGCGSLHSPPGIERAQDDTARQLPLPSWNAAGSLRHRAPAAVPDADSSPASGAVSVLYSQDPLKLRQEVAATCQKTRGAPHVLRSLVADLYFSGVDPAAGTEALLLGDCGPFPDILSEMVARGGPESRAAVVARARTIQGAGAGRRIESAVNAGLARYAGLRATESDAPPDALPAYGMLYFPSAKDLSNLDTAMALNRLYEDAIPGYGIYTFILLGRGFAHSSERDAARYRELFRVIETYVAAAAEVAEPSPETHAFLVPISPENAGAPLIDQLAIDLSEQMRRHFGQSLRRDGETRLAMRLDRNAGPFLVSAIEPRLFSVGQFTPRLVTDLSALGPEYIYGVVDAYDRPIPLELNGRVESLALIRHRLRGLPIKPVMTQDGQTSVNPRRALTIGRFAGAPAGPAGFLS